MIQEQPYTIVACQEATTFVERSNSVVWYDIANEHHFWMQWRLRILESCIKKAGINRDDNLHGLDIGCGTGVLRWQIENATQWVIDGSELDANALSINKPTRGQHYLYNIEKRHGEFQDKYDLITLFDILEHFSEPAAFLDDALYHLKPGGHCFINVPAIDRFRSRYDDIAGHHRRYNKALLREQIESVGLELVDIRYWGLILIPPCWMRKLIDVLVKEDKDVILKGFEPPGKVIHNLFRLLGQTETTLLPRVPIGTSLMAVARKAK